jgi:hypothetical protein
MKPIYKDIGFQKLAIKRGEANVRDQKPYGIL